jgi:hypothetical protein
VLLHSVVTLKPKPPILCLHRPTDQGIHRNAVALVLQPRRHRIGARFASTSARSGYEGGMYIGLGTVVLILVIVVIVLMLRRGAV